MRTKKNGRVIFKYRSRQDGPAIARNLMEHGFAVIGYRKSA